MLKLRPHDAWLLWLLLLLPGAVTQQSCNSPVQKVRALVYSDDLTPPEMDTMQTITDTIHAEIVNSWHTFNTLDGKYPEDIELLDMEPLKTRLSKLLGPQMQEDFLERFDVTPPLEVEENILFDEGYEVGHRDEAAAIAVDMNDDIIYVGLNIGHHLRIFSEKGDTHYPQKFQTWIKKFKQ
ncbi:hypothetical protein CLV59_101882 [Chitinophaga dinghuensis]|uniref:Uncharacterized protein n=1 Tax=Chitinophaga dinghuensis TaxID=1539050 RepID=A0A327WC70_9BACT|nr:hypothetical protein [Chitinophaga dinghuensis]RAJ88115.1 hypothetical protein CLV59_101882 [Chitinophaga dinghuensis]